MAASEESKLLDELRALGLHLTADGLQTVRTEIKQSNLVSMPAAGERKLSAEDVFNHAINRSLKGIAAPCLDELKKSSSSGSVAVLDGLRVLQIVASRNVSAPESRPDSTANPRLLDLTLFDGHTRAHAIEYSACPSLKEAQLPPGVKLVLRDVRCLHGVLLLEPRAIVRTCGAVDKLAESWKIKQDADAQRAFVSQLEVGEEAPPAFVPLHLQDKKQAPQQQQLQQQQQQSQQRRPQQSKPSNAERKQDASAHADSPADRTTAVESKRGSASAPPASAAPAGKSQQQQSARKRDHVAVELETDKAPAAQTQPSMDKDSESESAVAASAAQTAAAVRAAVASVAGTAIGQSKATSFRTLLQSAVGSVCKFDATVADVSVLSKCQCLTSVRFVQVQLYPPSSPQSSFLLQFTMTDAGRLNTVRRYLCL